MQFLSNSEFKSLARQNKSIRPALRKTSVGNVAMVADRQIKFTFSTSQMDRDYDVIAQDGIDVSIFTTNPVIFYSHNYDTLPIGKCVSIGIEDGNLTGVIEFAPADNPAIGSQAEGVYQLCRDGYLNTVSIGFIATEWSFADDPDRYERDGADVSKCELVECSIVGVPSNRGALIQEIGTGSIQEPVSEPLPEIEPDQPKHYRASRLQRILASLD